ncbi:MAG: ATPase domain-containing protein [Candidatus Syntropharchaeia archaeon]
MAYSILYHNARENGSKGVFITLEQDIRSLLQHMSKFNMGGDKNLLVVDYDGVESRIKEDRMFERNWIKRVANYARDLKEKEDYDLVVIDSLDALYSLTTIENPRREIYHLFRALRNAGITSFLVSEMMRGEDKFSKYGVEDFLSDAIIHLDLQKKPGVISTLERYIGIIKMRSTYHTTQYLPLFYAGDRFTVYSKEDLEL